MQTIGERLEEARKRKGISIREAAEATKIRSDYLQKFEANSFDIDLPALYLRGFLRSYAKYLDLDVDRLGQDLTAALASEGKPARRDSREVLGRVDFGVSSPPSAEEDEKNKPSPARNGVDQAILLKYGLFIGGAVVVILFGILLVNVFSSKGPSPAKPTPVAEVPAPAARPDPAQTLTLTAMDPTRAKIVQDSDGRVLFDGSLARGETRSLPKIGRLLITVEDRTKLRVEVNGRRYDIPPLVNGGNYGRFALD